MHHKFKLALLALTLIPVLLAGIFGYQMLLGMQARNQQQLDELISFRLAAIETGLNQTLDDTAQRLLAALPAPISEAALQDFARSRPELSQLLWLDTDGQRRYPPPAANYRNDVTDFLKRSEPLWLGGELLRIANTSKESPVLAPAQRSRSYDTRGASFEDAAAPAATPAPSPAYGWYTWFWGNSMRHLLWQRVDNGVVGLELNAERLKADLIAALPDAGDADDRLVRLYDSRGDVLYEWGGYTIPEGRSPTLSYSLAAPLASWRLDWYSGAQAQTALAQNLLLSGFLLMLLLALGGISAFLLREHQRERRLSEQRVNFVNQVSHELKTPLTNVRLYAELSADQLEAELESDHPVRKFLKIINEESLRLTRLINNVLNYARDQREQLQLQPRPAVPDDIIRGVLDSFRPAFERQGIIVSTDLQASRELRIDPDATEQILVNLLSNIEKYAANGKSAVISSRIDGDTLTIVVEDAGPGIPKAAAGHVFDDFYRVTDRIDEGVSGTGIGLSIARQLARLHSGDLRLLPSASGARFELSLRGAS